MSLPLHIRESGDGDTVILLLHGLFGSSANWGGVARQLSNDYRVLVPDLRNHGRSRHDADVSYDAMAEDLIALLDKHGIEQAIVVGHSMGGKVAMQLALSHPQRVAGIAVVDMAPVNYRHNFESVFRGFDAVDLAQLKNRTEADEQMARHVLEPGVRAFLLQNLNNTTGGWKWRLNLSALRAGQSQITGFLPPPGATYRGPAWFIHGANSDYLLPSHEAQIYALFPRARICSVAGAGHWVYAEQPQGFTDCLQRFLQRL